MASFDASEQAFARKLISAVAELESANSEFRNRHAQPFKVIIQDRIEACKSFPDGTSRCADAS
jgi:hypothetical protein